MPTKGAPTDHRNDTSYMTEEQRRELELFRQVRPYLKKCLDLNHDIGNPLAGILGYCELMQSESGELSEDARRSLEIIHECTERISRALDVLGEEKVILAAGADLGRLTRELDSERQ